MSDFIDNNQDLDDRLMEQTLEEIRARRSSGLIYTGFCHYLGCEEPIDKPKLFCNSTCSKDWELYNKKRGLRH